MKIIGLRTQKFPAGILIYFFPFIIIVGFTGDTVYVAFFQSH